MHFLRLFLEDMNHKNLELRQETLVQDTNPSPHKYVRKLQVPYWKYYWYYKKKVDCSSTVVKVLCYKSEGRWFDPS